MLNIQFSDRYITAHDLLLEDDGYNEEVIAEASMEPFHLTCSIGIDRNENYITWNLRYHDLFIGHKTTTFQQLTLDVFNRQELINETQFKFRQLLFRAANQTGSEAGAARTLLTSISHTLCSN